MIVVRFQLTCKPESTDIAKAALAEVVKASRQLDGVISFDVGQDVTDPHSFIATEVFEDKAALERQEALPATQKVIGMLPDLVAAEPAATIFEISSSTPWG